MKYTTDEWDRAFRILYGPDAFVSDLNVAVPGERENVDAVAEALADVRRAAYRAGYSDADNGNDPDPEWTS